MPCIPLGWVSRGPIGKEVCHSRLPVLVAQSSSVARNKDLRKRCHPIE